MPDIPIADEGDDGYAHPMEERVSKVEADIRDIKSSTFDIREIIIRMDAKLDATLPHLATKAEFAELRTEMATGFSNLRTEMISGDAALRHEMMAESTALRKEIADISTALRVEMVAGFAEKPSKTYMWGILAVLLTAYGCGLAGLAVLK